jgi:hypothetical protein
MALDTSVWIYHFERSVAYGQAADSVLEAVTQAAHWRGGFGIGAA